MCWIFLFPSSTISMMPELISVSRELGTLPLLARLFSRYCHSLIVVCAGIVVVQEL